MSSIRSRCLNQRNILLITMISTLSKPAIERSSVLCFISHRVTPRITCMQVLQVDGRWDPGLGLVFLQVIERHTAECPVTSEPRTEHHKHHNHTHTHLLTHLLTHSHTPIILYRGWRCCEHHSDHRCNSASIGGSGSGGRDGLYGPQKENYYILQSRTSGSHLPHQARKEVGGAVIQLYNYYYTSECSAGRVIRVVTSFKLLHWS